MAFIDEAKIFVKAGNGGKGCDSFYRLKYFRYPRPDGGDGGKGGDIIFVADPRIQTLLDYRFRQHYKAQTGAHASSKGKTGRSGEDCELRVPVGTVIRDHDTGLLIRDLSVAGARVVVVKGGAGGHGNQEHQTSTLPVPGEERTLHLELKLIADVGLIGFPNVGKSTLITKISKVRSKIANYPFTTKQPILGVVKNEYDECDFIVADLPGLIEGAHEGKGLGDRFLKHAERTKILVHLIDMGGSEGRDPLDDYQKISKELSAYSERLAVKYKLIVANKMDLPGALENLERFRQAVPEKIFAISALQDDIEALMPLINEIRSMLKNEKPQNEGEQRD
jgi:GTP-binding protein